MDAEPVAAHPGLMRVKGFGAFENGALARSWELILTDEEIEGRLKGKVSSELRVDVFTSSISRTTPPRNEELEQSAEQKLAR